MKIAIASDHAGFALKQFLRAELRLGGHDVADFGPADDNPVDYADYAHPVAATVAAGAVERGLLICGSGVGMSIAANRTPGVRAAVVHDPDIARLSREHNDANIIVFGARCLSGAQARDLLAIWMSTPFSGGRHQRRVDKIEAT